MMLIGCIVILILLSRSGAGSAGAGAGAGAGGGSIVDRVIDFFKGGKSESSDSASVGSSSRAGGKAEELTSDVIDAK